MKGSLGPAAAGAALLAAGLAAVALPPAQRLLARAAPGGSVAVNRTVSSVAELEAALAGARGGVIRLMPGTYPPVLIRDVHPAAMVTITSADSSRPAVMTGVTVRDSSNLVLDRLSFGVLAPTAQYGLSIQGSQHVAAHRLAFAWPGGVQGRSVVSAIFVRNSQQIEISDSSFRDHWHGISFLDVEDLRIADNLLTDLRTDGIRGGGVKHLLVERNVIGNFHPEPGDHPDGIQLWSTNEREPGRDVVIRDNLVWRGAGGIAQGVFIRDTFGKLPFERVTVSGNLLVGSMYNGIALLGVSSGNVTGNRVVAYPDMKSWIALRQSQDVTLSGNAAMIYTRDSRLIDPPATNRLIDPAHDQGLREITEWLAQHPTMRARFDALRASRGVSSPQQPAS